jgi:hypothetical protein
MKSLLVSLLALSVSTGLCLAACKGDSKKPVVGAGGAGGDGSAAGPVAAGGSAVGMAGAGGEEAGGAGSGIGGMLGAAGAAGGGGEGGEAAPTFEAIDYRGLITASISGTPEDATITLGAEFIDVPSTPVQEQAVSDLIAHIATSARDDDGPACIPQLDPFQDWLNVPPNIERGESLTLSADGTELVTATPLPVDPIYYEGYAQPGPLGSEAFSFFSGSPLLGLDPDPVEVPILEGGFVNETFAWLSTDATFPVQLIAVNTPPGAHLVLSVGTFLCRVDVPPNADQGFTFEVPQAVVDTLPIYPEAFQVQLDTTVARKVSVSDGWVRIETFNSLRPLFARGSIDAP